MLLAAVAMSTLAAAAKGVARVHVDGTSMRPSLEPGDRLLAVRGLTLRRGDIVTVVDPRAPGRLLVKRVAAVHDTGIVVLGDRPQASTDSRHFGAVPRALVRGKVVYRYAPPHRRGRPARSTGPGTAASARMNAPDTEERPWPSSTSPDTSPT